MGARIGRCVTALNSWCLARGRNATWDQGGLEPTTVGGAVCQGISKKQGGGLQRCAMPGSCLELHIVPGNLNYAARSLPLDQPLCNKHAVQGPDSLCAHTLAVPCQLPHEHPQLPAGAICVGKTNLDQFACGLVGTRSPYGTPPNAFDDRSASAVCWHELAAAVHSGAVLPLTLAHTLHVMQARQCSAVLCEQDRQLEFSRLLAHGSASGSIFLQM